MPRTAKHLAGGVKAGKKFMLRLSEELLARVRSGAELRGMETSEYVRKAVTDALNNDALFVEKHGETFYLGARPGQVEKFLNSPLSKEEVYYGNMRRIEAEVSLRILSNRLASLEGKIAVFENRASKKDEIAEVRRKKRKLPVLPEIDL